MDKMNLPEIDNRKLKELATGKLRQKIFEKALQMKVDAAQAAFPPSGQDKNKK